MGKQPWWEKIPRNEAFPVTTYQLTEEELAKYRAMEQKPHEKARQYVFPTIRNRGRQR